jgi:quercetin dioxygenase-like cupin family protein
MAVITAGEAPTFEAPGATVTGLASPSRGARDTAVWRIRFEADHASPSHSLSHEEVFVVLDGSLTARYADDASAETARAGGALVVPAGRPFTIAAEGGPASAVCAFPVGAVATLGEDVITPPWAV